MRARGLRPRRVVASLALSRRNVLPSAQPDGVGTLKYGPFAAQYPARMPPVNASPRPLRATTHDSGPMWFATPSSCETFTHYFLVGFHRRTKIASCVAKSFLILIRLSSAPSQSFQHLGRCLGGQHQFSISQAYTIALSRLTFSSRMLEMDTEIVFLRILRIYSVTRATGCRRSTRRVGLPGWSSAQA